MKLRKNIIFLLTLAILSGCAGSQSSMQDTEPSTDTNALLKHQEEISVEFMKPRLTAFSDDSMKGRETGTPEEDKAARYLAKQYREIGLQPMGDNDSYFQNFRLNATKTDSITFKLSRTEGEEKKLIDQSTASKNSAANFIRQFGGTDSLQGQVVFAGFGVTDTSRDVNHLQGTSLKGKWVMVFQEIPNMVKEDTLIDTQIDSQARFQQIMKQGAEGILLIPTSDAEQFMTMAKKAQSNFGEIGRMSLAYREKEEQGFSRGYNFISPQLATQLLGLEDSITLPEYRQKVIENITSFKPVEIKYELSHIPHTSQETIDSKNVLAFHEGADPKLKDEVVVLTSHYDHVGIGQPDSTGDRIYNGADDDGSGTIGLLNVAKAFSEAGEDNIKPKRSILFLNVSAEEKGLLGSRYYSDHPVFPMDKTVANINIDMIGRIDAEHEKKGIEEYSYIIGAEIISSQLDSLIKAANKQTGQIELSKRYNDLKDPNQFYRRSDHWHFGRKGVPFVFFFTGVHEDYHRPSDEVHKIRFDKMREIVRTIYGSAVHLANTENAPEVDNQEFIEITKSDN